MTLGFFILSGLDLLDQLHTSTTAAEREEYVRWVYSNQLPEGGFRGSPATDLRERRSESNRIWDPANVAATAFALLSLAVLRDDFKGVKRKECLMWLTQLQRPDGSFGETLSENGNIEGGTDTRYSYCATVIRWILRGSVQGRMDELPDINVDKLVDRIRQSEV
jgi:geranylgeranyl transferase type-1 subunit beta